MKGSEQRKMGVARTAGMLAVSVTALLAVSVTQGSAKEAEAPAPQVRKALPAPAVQQPRMVPAAPSPLSAAENILNSRIRDIGQSFNGDIGIAVRDIQTGHVAAYDGNTFFPQQSVSKFWVALTALDRADRGHLNLDSSVTVRKEDLTLFHQPIAQLVDADGYTTKLSNLMYRALTQSDNTCNDFVLWKAGGPSAVQSFLADKKISGVRFGPGERVMQSRIAGMEWKQSFAGRAFYAARNAVPTSVRRAAFENYIRNPVDGATPVGVVDALARLKQGELLSPASTRKLLDIMSDTRTGPQRLKGGLSSGWKLAHKTGTGQVFGGEQAGYNDIGIVTAPDGRSYAVAVFIRRTSAPLSHRMQAMQNTVRAVINYANALPAERFAKAQPRPVQAVQPAASAPSRTELIAATVASLEEEDGE